MSLKFRKRITLFPGFTLNLSKSGMSATVGIRGLNVNVGKTGSYLNMGLPGTGIYDRVKLGGNKSSGEDVGTSSQNVLPEQKIADAYKEIEIKSFNPELITSEGLFGLKESILKAKEEKEDLLKDFKITQNSFRLAKIVYYFSYTLLVGFVIKWFKVNFEEKKIELSEAKNLYENFSMEVEFNLEKEILNEYIDVKNNFLSVSRSEIIWDIKTTKSNDRVKERTCASDSVSREKVTFKFAKLDFINSKFEALKLSNANGADIYIYPGFIAMLHQVSNEFGLVDFREFDLHPSRTSFVETDPVPSDSKIIGHTWKYVNKNGSPDRRFNNNFEIPIAQYHEMNLTSKSGMNESYLFSNYEAGTNFSNTLIKYAQTLKILRWSNELIGVGM